MPKVPGNSFICLFVLSCTLGYSQTTKRILLDCKSEILRPGKLQPKLDFSSKVNSIANNSFLSPLHPSKKPVFCRMEDDLHKRFNVWIVMRAGSDEEYRKLIEEKETPKHESTP